MLVQFIQVLQLIISCLANENIVLHLVDLRINSLDKHGHTFIMFFFSGFFDFYN